MPINQNVPFLWHSINGRRRLINIIAVARNIIIEYNMSNDINERKLQLYYKQYSFWWYSNLDCNEDRFYDGFRDFIREYIGNGAVDEDEGSHVRPVGHEEERHVRQRRE